MIKYLTIFIPETRLSDPRATFPIYIKQIDHTNILYSTSRKRQDELASSESMMHEGVIYWLSDPRASKPTPKHSSFRSGTVDLTLNPPRSMINDG